MEVSKFQDLLSRFVESKPKLLQALSRVESNWLHEDLSGIHIEKPIYITGLARSGTTVLLELLASHPETATHTYRDFPLVHIPVWWNWYLDRASRQNNNIVERSHKDGIFVTPDSPEAMEEVIWMSFFTKCHDSGFNNVIKRDTDDFGFEDFYRAHIKKILFMKHGKRYLAKGNYNVTRLDYILSRFTDACFVIPVRDPVAHVASLKKQHKLFCEAERQNIRVLNYMRRSGHYEFGLDRRSINFGNEKKVERIEKLWAEGQEIRGLAAHWALVYGFISDEIEGNKALAKQTIVVLYEDLCKTPRVLLQQLYKHCELEIDRKTLELQASRIKAPDYYSHGFTDEEVAVIDEETHEAKARITGLTVG